MNVICVICSDLLLQSENVYYTPCGHVFHLDCLTQWIERSKSCPQCRKEVKNSGIKKLYFTSSNDDVAIADSSMQEKIDSLKFQVMLREKDIKYYTSKNHDLQKQSVGLRKEVRKVESEINAKNSAIYALKEQIKYFKEQCAERDQLKMETIRLRKKVEDLREIQVLLHGPVQDVYKMVGKTKDPDTLITFISVMKKELMRTMNKCKDLRLSMQRLKEKRAKEKLELQNKLAFAKDKYPSLTATINALGEFTDITKTDRSQLDLQEVERVTNSSIESIPEKAPKDDKRDKSCRSSTLADYKISKRTSRNSEESSYKTEIGESSGLEKSLTEHFSNSDCPIPYKRAKQSISHTEKNDKGGSSRTSDSKYTNQDPHYKSKKKQDNITTSEKDISDNNLEANNIIDLT